MFNPAGHLGTWVPYIAEPEMFDWYQLHPEQQEQLEHYHFSPAHMEPLSAERWQEVRREVCEYARLSVKPFKNPYHNIYHFEAVREDGMEMISVYEELAGCRLPEAVKQAYDIALLTHDCHHCGSAFRTDAWNPEFLHMPEVGQRVSQEWVSAVATNRLCIWLEIPLPWRLFITMVHYTSTFGGNTPKGQELGIPVVAPQSLWGCGMQAADVVPPEHFSTVKRRMLAVQCGETLATDPPATMNELFESQLGFYDHYVTAKFNRLDEVAGGPLTRELGWRERLRNARQNVFDLSRGADPETVEQLREEAMVTYNRYL